MPETLRNIPVPATPLSTQVVGSRVLVYETVDSTNECALRLGGDGTVIISDSQTAGRGRHGRSWHSKPGLGLYFSIAFERAVDGLAFAAPLAVRDALRGVADVRVKWPNDVLVAERKVCGVLIETRQTRTALGIGINVHHAQDDFPPELRGRATSLAAATGTDWNRGELMRDVLTRLDERVIVIRSGGLDDVFHEWSEACALRGRRVRSGDVEGIVVSMDRDGALVLDTANGAKRILLGDIVEMERA